MICTAFICEKSDGSQAAGETCSGVANLNSYREIASAIEACPLEAHAIEAHAIEKRPTVAFCSTLSAAVGVAALGETMPSAAFVEPAPRGGPETILLVEDEGFVRKVTAEVLESAGYKVVIAGNAGEALEVYRRLHAPVDLLLADVVMPGMSGRALAAEFESLCPSARVLLMSGYAGQLAAYCLSSSVSSYGKTYLAKPFSVRTLLKKVREVLAANPFDRGALA
jgi:CheY-like chemotaxis protein